LVSVNFNAEENFPTRSIYPNPCTNNSIIELKGYPINNTPVNVELYNITGKKIDNALLNNSKSNDNSFNLDAAHNLPSGIYIVKILTEGKMHTSKLIIK